jgi:Na+/proline symporter
MAWGLGYFGQPHILARFMSIRSIKELPASTVIAVVWVAFSLFFAVLVGVVGIPMFDELSGGDHEKVFILMIREIFTPWLGGILMALFSRRTGWQAALAGMITGTIVLVVWERLGLGAVMYEIVPGFVANFAAILIVNQIIKIDGQDFAELFDAYREEVQA